MRLNLLKILWNEVIFMIYTIEEIKEKAVPIVKEYGVNSLSLFGSYAKGDATEDSDIDFYFDDDDLKGLLQYTALVRRLEEVFDCHVDLVSTGIDNEKFLNKIRKYGVLLYERSR